MTDPLDETADIAERSAALDRRIAAIPVDQFFTKRTIAVVAAVFFAMLAVLMVLVLAIGVQTRDAVRHEIPGLKAQVEARDRTIEGATSAIGQLTDALVASQQQVRDLGGTPTDVRITTQPPDDP